MYGWIWRRLPGGPVTRTAQLILALAVVAVTLWYYVFPWLWTVLPLDQAGLTGGG